MPTKPQFWRNGSCEFQTPNVTNGFDDVHFSSLLNLSGHAIANIIKEIIYV